MPNSSVYFSELRSLYDDSDQLEAYNSTGHCVVLAGPGSGKTNILSLKLSRLLKEDGKEPRGVACITYSHECALELKRRLYNLGIEPTHRVFIGTIHSFSLNKIILPYHKNADLGLSNKFEVATKKQKHIALEEAFSRVIDRADNPKSWESKMNSYRREVLDRNSEDWAKKDPEIAKLVDAYEANLRSKGLIDYEDMPLLALRALSSHQWIQQAILSKYPALLVDEYQDLSKVFHNIVLKLCFSTRVRLFAVGDVDQSIYGFAGGNPEFLYEISKRNDVQTVKLKTNYRSGNRIVTASAYALGEDRGYEASKSTGEGHV